MSVPSTGSVQPVAAPPGIRDMPKPVQRSQDVAQPNPVPKEVTTRQAASPEVPNIQPAQQLYEIATTRQALRPGIQETSKAVQQSQQIVQPNPIPRVPVRRETELIPPSPLLGVPAVIGTTASALSGVISTAVPPPPTPATPPLERIRVGGPPTAAKLIKEIKPMYPPLARQARIQGTVRLEGVIGPDGTVQDLKVLLGHPLLREGAIRAVKQWRYQPVLLNGVPVAVITTMDVRFSLGN
ncbi:MAG: energy transducer TonB [Acidobacteria bacterium]|nr:energy transducer TonB [Acidobacteriota bacterium]